LSHKSEIAEMRELFRLFGYLSTDLTARLLTIAEKQYKKAEGRGTLITTLKSRDEEIAALFEQIEMVERSSYSPISPMHIWYFGGDWVYQDGNWVRMDEEKGNDG